MSNTCLTDLIAKLSDVLEGPPSYLSFKQAIAKLFDIQNSLAAIKHVG
jgi:hypothetical protein